MDNKNQNNKQNKNKQSNTNNMIIINKLNAIYPKLKNKIRTRYDLQQRQEQLWNQVKHGYNRSRSLDDIDNRIGQATHMINVYIGQLSHIKYNHKAMNLACDYLDKEIVRCSKIIHKWESIIDDVYCGIQTLIDSTGYEHNDTSDPEEYISHKEDQLKRLKHWRKQIGRYKVKQ